MQVFKDLYLSQYIVNEIISFSQISNIVVSNIVENIFEIFAI